jgi:hypothetical protein
VICVRCTQPFKREPQSKYCWPCNDKTRIEQSIAYRAVRKAIRQGDLAGIDTQYCVDCGAFAELYDHRSYLRPTEVEPVCRRCNILRGPALFNARAA